MMMREDMRTCPGLYSLPPPQFKALAAFADEKQAVQGEMFFQEEEVLHALYLLVTGSVAISRIWLKHHDTFVRSVMPGELFGWSALQYPYKAGAKATAITPCRVWTFARTKLETILKNDPDLMAMLAQRETAVSEHIPHFQVESLARIMV